jgi:hypothetical protein
MYITKHLIEKFLKGILSLCCTSPSEYSELSRNVYFYSYRTSKMKELVFEKILIESFLRSFIAEVSQRQKKVKFSISFLDHLVRCFKKTKYTTRCSMKSSTIYKEQIMLQLQFYWWKWIKFWSTNFWNFEKKMIFFVASKISGTEFCLFWKQ